mgnify:CR=1 FL=1
MIDRKFAAALSVAVVLTASLGIAALGVAAPAAPKGADSKECGLIGTWSGWADAPWPNTPLAWLAVHTAGSQGDKNGEMLMNWVYVHPILLRGYNRWPNATRLTPGHGVWEQIGKGQYKYTWYGYGTDDEGVPRNSIRVSGFAKQMDCNNVEISYVYEAFDGAIPPQDMNAPTDPYYSTAGTAGETRVPLVP